MATLAQVRRAHIRQQLTPEEQLEFDEHYGEEDDLLYEEEEESDEDDDDEEEGEGEPNQDEMDYYM